MTNDELIRRCRQIAALHDAMETTEEIQSSDLPADDYETLEAFAVFAIPHMTVLCERLRVDIKATAP